MKNSLFHFDSIRFGSDPIFDIRFYPIRTLNQSINQSIQSNPIVLAKPSSFSSSSSEVTWKLLTIQSKTNHQGRKEETETERQQMLYIIFMPYVYTTHPSSTSTSTSHPTILFNTRLDNTNILIDKLIGL